MSAEIKQEIRFSAEEQKKVQEIVSRYPEGKQKSALLPLLHIAQAKWGWLSVEVMDYVASLLSLKPIEVYEVATFYTMFHVKPVGKYVLEVCRTGPCALVGAERIIGHVENKLGIKVGETTADGMFTLKTVECLASCGTGPMMQVFENYYENLTEDRINQLLDDCRSQAHTREVGHTGSSL